MNALLRSIFILIFGGTLAFSIAFAQEKSGWKQTDSENFHVISDAANEETKEIAGKLEDFRRSFFTLFRQNQLKSPIPTRILIFKSAADYAEVYKSQASDPAKNGFYEGQDANYIIVFLNDSEADFRSIYHQYFHYLLNNHIGKSKIPAWLNEGLAQIYEKFEPNIDPKTNFRNSENKYESLKQSKLLPAENFFGTDYYTLNQQEKHGAGVFYAQSQATVEYLFEQDDGEKFAQFVDSLSSGGSPGESFAKSFQLDVQSLEKNLQTFIERKSTEKSTSAKIQTRQALDLKFSPLAEWQTESYFGDFLYQANRYDEAALHSLKALSLNPSASFPRSTLGLVRMRQYKTDEAFEQLDKSLESKDADSATYYRYAYALSREGMTEYGFVSNYDAQAAEKIREFLDKAIRLNPDFAESYNLYAFVGFVRNEEIGRGLEFIARALQSAPGNEQYQLRKAELDMRQENFTRARKNAIDVYRNAANPGLRLYAQNTIQRIDSTEYQLMLSRRYEKLPYSDAISDKPFSDEEIARLRAKAMRESLIAALRQPAPDEKRIVGNIVGIDCKQNQVDFTVKTGDRIIRLYAESFEILKLMTFNASLSKSQIGCGASNGENAVIIYKNLQNSKPDVSGEIVSVEFVPKEFTLSSNN